MTGGQVGAERRPLHVGLSPVLTGLDLNMAVHQESGTHMLVI